ncbi:MAG TPA: hypothetical protein VIL74_18960 [Pyrinomonadaceae bacterium]|jgi:hypothetical protein
MIDERTIKLATEEILDELNLSGRRFAIEPALCPGDGENSRQIRLFRDDGRDRATIVDFQDKDGNVSIYFDDIKAKIRKQIETLVEVGA